MRQKAANYIRGNRDEFLPFLSDENGDPIDTFSFDEYCEKIKKSCKDGGQWGGEPEVIFVSI